MYNDIRLEKGLYSITGKNFTQALKQLDPDENYAGTELEGLDAFERQLKRFDIKIAGKNSDRVDKFFSSAESAVLFPEYVRRTIQQGMEENSILPEIIAAVSYTDGLDFRAFSITAATGDGSVAQAGSIGATNVRVATAGKALTKYARKLSISYESIRNQRLEGLNVILRALGAQVSSCINSAALTAVSSGISATTIAGSALAYSDLATFWAAMSKHNMTTMVCSPAVMAKILALDEMKYCISDYMVSGKVKTPYGVTIVKCAEITDSKIYGIDKNCAAEMFYGTDVVVDYDKLLTTQCDEISCSVMVGFGRIFDDAVKVLNASK